MTGPPSVPFDRIAERYDETRGGVERGVRFAAVLDGYVAPGRVLEVGTGTGVVAAGLRARGHAVVGIDLSLPMIRLAATRVGSSVAQADAVALPFPAAIADTVVCVWVLHVVGEPVRAVDEMRRVLRPGGRLLVAAGGPQNESDDEIDRIEAPLRERRLGRDPPDQVIAWVEGAGMRLLDRASTLGAFEDSPASAARRLEERVYSWLWDISDEEWSTTVQPAIEALRALPDPDGDRLRTHQHAVLVFEKPVSAEGSRPPPRGRRPPGRGRSP